MRNIGWYNGEICELSELRIPALDRSVYFGDGVYDAVYSRHKKAYLLEKHVNRLLYCAHELEIYPDYDAEKICGIVEELLQIGECDQYFIYMQVSRGSGIREHIPADIGSPNLLIMLYERGISPRHKEPIMRTEDDTRHGLCRLKTLNLLPNIRAMQHAHAMGADGVIFIRDRYVTECGNCNLFIIKEGAVYTPPADGNILEGVQRSETIRKCRELDIPVSEKYITYCELMNADEVVVTSAGQLFNRVAVINDIPVGGKGGMIFERLQDELFGAFEEATK